MKIFFDRHLAQVGADLIGAERRALLDRPLHDLEQLCHVPCDNPSCDARGKFQKVTDNARVKCRVRCLQKSKDVTEDWSRKSARAIFQENMRRVESFSNKLLSLQVQCDDCGEQLMTIKLQDTVEKLYLDLRAVLANDKSQPLLYIPGEPNADIPDDAKAVCALSHGESVNKFVQELPNYISAIHEALQPEGVLHKRLKEKGQVAKDKFDSEIMTYIRIGLGLQELGQYTIVLELWPKGYKSPKHHHGGCAGSVRVIHGSLDVQLFNSILDEEPMEFTGNDGRLGLGRKKLKTLELGAGQTTWLNRQNWWVHKVECNQKHPFALSLHLYKSCTDAFAFVKPDRSTTSRTNFALIEKGMPSNDYFWNIDLPESDPRVTGQLFRTNFPSPALHVDLPLDWFLSIHNFA